MGHIVLQELMYIGHIVFVHTVLWAWTLWVSYMHIVLRHDVFRYDIVLEAYRSWGILFPGAHDFLGHLILRSHLFWDTLFLWYIISAEHVLAKN